MAVLLQFNDHEHMTIYELEEATKLNVKELEKQVNSLIDTKFLLNDSASALASDTKISINYDYKNKRTKFKVPLISQKEASHVKSILDLTIIFIQFAHSFRILNRLIKLLKKIVNSIYKLLSFE